VACGLIAAGGRPAAPQVVVLPLRIPMQLKAALV